MENPHFLLKEYFPVSSYNDQFQMNASNLKQRKSKPFL